MSACWSGNVSIIMYIAAVIATFNYGSCGTQQSYTIRESLLYMQKHIITCIPCYFIALGIVAQVEAQGISLVVTWTAFQSL